MHRSFELKTPSQIYLPEKAEELKRRIEKSFPGRKTATVLEVLKSEDEMVRDYAKFLFDNDYSLYTAKQWGVSAEEIDPSVLKRVPLRFDYNADYFDDTYQVLPKTSYTDFFNHLLCHPNISVELCVEALDYICVDGEGLKYCGKTCEFPVVYTGAILLKNGSDCAMMMSLKEIYYFQFTTAAPIRKPKMLSKSSTNLTKNQICQSPFGNRGRV